MIAYSKKYRIEETEETKARRRSYAKQWRQDNKDKARRAERRWRYKVSDAVLLKLETEAAGKCFLCKQPCTELHLDHDHNTGQVRHLICPKCNSGLGFFDDSVSKLKDAVAYLQHFERDLND